MSSVKTIHKPFDSIKIIYNNDAAILDFLADLKDRRVIKNTQMMINEVMATKRTNFALLHRSTEDGMVILVLYGAPFKECKAGNNFMLYAYNNCKGLCAYFGRWLQATDPENKLIRASLADINNLLTYHWCKFEAPKENKAVILRDDDESDVQCDFIG